MILKDKIVVITGGSRGFGKTLAEFFIREEAKVVISSNNKKELKDVSKEIEAFGIYADVTKEKELTSLLNKVIKDFGRVDIWINNAGLWIPHDWAENFDMNKVQKMFEVNVIGTMNGSRVALRHMKERGMGAIINIISDSALAPRPMSSTYCASKWAVNGFTKSVREENKNINILSIFPGGMKTEIFGNARPDNYDSFMDTEYVAQKVIDNLKKESPEEELIIQKN